MRKLALALALTTGALSVADYLDWRGEQRRLASAITDSGLAGPLTEAGAGLARETVPARAAARLAWRLLGLEIDRQWLGELPADEREAEIRRGPDRLRLARRLAEEALSRQPASWRAATVVGASRYLEEARAARQDQPLDAWRQPLETAMRLAPGSSEPAVLLASFYLSRWSSLSGPERDELPRVLARAFEDPPSLRRLLPAWMRLAPSLGLLLEPIPDRPDAWREVGREFLRRGDLERFAGSHQRYVESLPADLADRLERGRARLRGGHPRAGLGLLYSVFAAPPDLAYADSFAGALAELPVGSPSNAARRNLEEWLAWAADLCAVGRCPLDAQTMARLRAVAEPPGDAGAPAPDSEIAPGPDWSADDWQRRGGTFRLRLRADHATTRLRLEMAGIPPAGAALELRWDGRFLGVAAVEPGEPIVWPLTAGEGPHLLQIQHLSGRPLMPGRLTLEPAPASG